MNVSKNIMMLAIVAISTFVLIASATEKGDSSTVLLFEAELIGTVVDSSTGEGIEGAEVTISEVEQTAKTDQYGTFTITDLDAGTFIVSVTAEGYQDAEEEVEVTEEEGGTIEIILNPEEN